MNYFTPNIIMALTDYIPVILFFIASIYLIRFTKRNAKTIFTTLLILGSSLVFLGGFIKASWKLIYAIFDVSFIWMRNIQFMLLAPGTMFIFISVLSIALLQKPKKIAPSTLNSLGGTPFFIPLLTTLTLSTAGYLISLMVLAKRRNCIISVFMYGIYFVIMLIMGANSNKGDFELINWICQAINSLGMAALLIGHYRLNKADLDNKISVAKAA